MDYVVAIIDAQSCSSFSLADYKKKASDSHFTRQLKMLVHGQNYFQQSH
jgi:hypothetical protein